MIPDHLYLLSAFSPSFFVTFFSINGHIVSSIFQDIYFINGSSRSVANNCLLGALVSQLPAHQCCHRGQFQMPLLKRSADSKEVLSVSSNGIVHQTFLHTD